MTFMEKMLSKLLGQPVAENPPAAPPREPRLGSAGQESTLGRSLEALLPRNFAGHFYPSPSGRWVVGCGDSGVNKRGTQVTLGEAVLLDRQSNRLIHHISGFERLSDATVSDVGTYVLHDQLLGDKLQGDLVAMGLDGRERYRREFKANIYNIGISPCGRYCVAQTANAPGSQDANRLEVADVHQGQTVFSVSPSAAWSREYGFEVDAEGALVRLLVQIEELGRFAYAPTGEFIDREGYEAAVLKSDSTGAKLGLATVLRARGESLESGGQLQEALAAYDTALALNPKIGVSKRAQAIRKRLGL